MGFDDDDAILSVLFGWTTVLVARNVRTAATAVLVVFVLFFEGETTAAVVVVVEGVCMHRHRHNEMLLAGLLFERAKALTTYHTTCSVCSCVCHTFFMCYDVNEAVRLSSLHSTEEEKSRQAPRESGEKRRRKIHVTPVGAFTYSSSSTVSSKIVGTTNKHTHIHKRKAKKNKSCSCSPFSCDMTDQQHQ